MPETIIDIEMVKKAIGKKVVEKADEYSDAHSQFKIRATQIYYAFIGKFLADEGPDKGWQSKYYPKMMKPKILAAWSQYLQAQTASKTMWEVEPRGINTQAASMAAKAMKNEMQEQAGACKMTRQLASGFLDDALYGMLFWQAPLVETRISRRWEPDLSTYDSSLAYLGGNPIWKQVVTREDMPAALHRNYFEMYPWPYSSDPQKGEGIFHRPFLSQSELQELAEQPGFDADAINEILKNGPDTPPAADKTDERMTARGWQHKNRKGYDLVFFSGKLGGEDLRGIPGFENESGRYAEVLVWVVNSAKLQPKVIKLVANPISGKFRPFMMSPYEQMPHEALGVGVGENSVDTAKALGGGIRLYLDGKKAALPQIAINTKYFGGSVVEFSPLKIWAFDQVQNAKDAIAALTLPDMTGGLIPLIEMLERFHDEITGIPKWTTGVDSKMLNKTATGISMIMNASSQLIRGAVENIDAFIIGPTGERFYDWNMENNPKMGIKGDFIVTPSGISTLMQKETLNQQLLGLYSLVVNPATMQNPFAMRLIRMVADGMGIKDVDAIMPNPDKMRDFAQQTPGAAAATLAPSAPSAPPAMPPGGLNV